MHLCSSKVVHAIRQKYAVKHTHLTGSLQTRFSTLSATFMCSSSIAPLPQQKYPSSRPEAREPLDRLPRPDQTRRFRVVGARFARGKRSTPNAVRHVGLLVAGDGDGKRARQYVLQLISRVFTEHTISFQRPCFVSTLLNVCLARKGAIKP